MDIKLSLIIPVYNGKESLIGVLDSIEASDTALEVIFVDDGSKDDSGDLLAKWIDYKNNNHTIHNLRLISQANSGVAAARNRGILESSTPYIMFCDQDDRFDSVYAKVFLEKIIMSEAEVVVGGYERVRGDGRILKRITLSDTPWSKFIVPAPWAHIYDKKFLIDNNIKFLASPIGEDIYFNLIAYSKAKKVVCIPDTSYKWMYNESSVSNAKQNIIRDDINPLFLLNNIYDGIEDYSFRDSKLMEYFFARYACWYMLFTFRGSKRADIDREYHRLHDWIRQHYPTYEKNRFLGAYMPKGEIRSTHFFVYWYYLLRKIGMMPGILKLLTK